MIVGEDTYVIVGSSGYLVKSQNLAMCYMKTVQATSSTILLLNDF